MRGVDETIFAISSPPGRGWRGVVRISGTAAIPVAAELVRLSSGEDPLQFAGHEVRDGEVLPWGDGPSVPGSLVIMRAPRSYTREDVAEIHTLSSPPVLAALSERLLERRIRPAGPGEFTRRAFLAGRIDLAQAEAVIQIIEAEDEASLRAAQRKLEGGLSKRIGSLKEELADLLARVEAGIDFSEQGIEIISDEGIGTSIEQLRLGIANVIDGQGAGIGSIRDSGIHVCLAGVPNVGKSSIFNRLVGEDAAVVTAEEGTTRDFLRATFEEDGIRFRLTDPAGIRDSKDPVEEEASRRARELIRSSDIGIVVVDGSREGAPREDEIIQMAPARSMLLVINKSDLPRRRGQGESIPEDRVVITSARTGMGFEELRTALVRIARTGKGTGPGADYMLAARERGLLRRAMEDLRTAARIHEQGGMDRLASDLREALDRLGEVTGEVPNEEILDRIFSRFCIGK
ncbi:MAG: tRNA uridine-5-carboxymethylaminomethyl(34) synthesis GTPase MnmE [Planctomycetota bacterium]|nr:tRNA uridine-5-carboxymethylaminomethyl(34) synthesis GTPase MnmE [Planctomycetota bacterium]